MKHRDYCRGTYGKACDEPANKENQLALSLPPCLQKSWYGQEAKWRMFDIVEQKERKHGCFSWFLLNQWISPTFLLCEENEATLGRICCYLQPNTSHSYSVQGSWEESLSLESSLFANPSEIPCKTPLNDSLLIVKQMDINKVPYKYSKTSYTHTHTHTKWEYLFMINWKH